MLLGSVEMLCGGFGADFGKAFQILSAFAKHVRPYCDTISASFTALNSGYLPYRI